MDVPDGKAYLLAHLSHNCSFCRFTGLYKASDKTI
jgi:hypothetical protein